MPGANSTRMGDTPGAGGTGSHLATTPKLTTTNNNTASDELSGLPGTSLAGSISADESTHVSSGGSGVESNTGGSGGPRGQITEQPDREISSTLSQSVSSYLSIKASGEGVSTESSEYNTSSDRPASPDAISPLAATSRSIAGYSLPLSLTPKLSLTGSATFIQKFGSSSLVQSRSVGSGGTETSTDPGPSTPFTNISTAKTSQPVRQTQTVFSGTTDIDTEINSVSSTPTVVTGLRSTITSAPLTPAGTDIRSGLATPSTASSSTISTVLLSVELSAEEAKNDTLSQRSLYWKRDETSGFVGDGTYQNTSTCSNATLFRRSNGQLLSRQRPLSVDPGVDFINLSDYPGGSISTTFSVVGRILVWNNTAFYGGAARFCQLQSGAVYGLFTENTGPEDCTLINLAVYTANECQNGTIVAPDVSSQPASYPSPTDIGASATTGSDSDGQFTADGSPNDSSTNGLSGTVGTYSLPAVRTETLVASTSFSSLGDIPTSTSIEGMSGSEIGPMSRTSAGTESSGISAITTLAESSSEPPVTDGTTESPVSGTRLPSDMVSTTAASSTSDTATPIEELSSGGSAAGITTSSSLQDAGTLTSTDTSRELSTESSPATLASAGSDDGVSGPVTTSPAAITGSSIVQPTDTPSFASNPAGNTGSLSSSISTAEAFTNTDTATASTKTDDNTEVTAGTDKSDSTAAVATVMPSNIIASPSESSTTSLGVTDSIYTPIQPNSDSNAMTASEIVSDTSGVVAPDSSSSVEETSPVVDTVSALSSSSSDMGSIPSTAPKTTTDTTETTSSALNTGLSEEASTSRLEESSSVNPGSTAQTTGAATASSDVASTSGFDSSTTLSTDAEVSSTVKLDSSGTITTPGATSDLMYTTPEISSTADPSTMDFTSSSDGAALTTSFPDTGGPATTNSNGDIATESNTTSNDIASSLETGSPESSAVSTSLATSTELPITTITTLSSTDNDPATESTGSEPATGEISSEPTIGVPTTSEMKSSELNTSETATVGTTITSFFSSSESPEVSLTSTSTTDSLLETGASFTASDLTTATGDFSADSTVSSVITETPTPGSSLTSSLDTTSTTQDGLSTSSLSSSGSVTPALSSTTGDSSSSGPSGSEIKDNSSATSTSNVPDSATAPSATTDIGADTSSVVMSTATDSNLSDTSTATNADNATSSSTPSTASSPVTQSSSSAAVTATLSSSTGQNIFSSSITSDAVSLERTTTNSPAETTSNSAPVVGTSSTVGTSSVSNASSSGVDSFTSTNSATLSFSSWYRFNGISYINFFYIYFYYTFYYTFHYTFYCVFYYIFYCLERIL
ncbi:hypothetical protein PG996_003525 [Apiospora saccharicola]|uniref:DUF7908 domain-containing protein n=1 Tax=Apiospora saccharicola TaxID=335842 RepID=A0ABR1W1I1_9PEZI